ncbi:MAG: lipid A export permease/ATP-binding protein MsbA [Halioglobus sp.]
MAAGSLPPAGVASGPTYRRLSRYLTRQWYWVVLCTAGFALYALGTVLLADLLQFLLDALNESPSVASGILSGFSYRLFLDSGQSALDAARTVIPVAVVAITAARGVGYFVGNYGIQTVARSLVHHLRCDVFRALLAQPAVLLDSQSKGSLVSKLTYNVEQLSEAATTALKTVLRETLILTGLLAYMAYVDWRLCLVFVAVMPVIAWIVSGVSKKFRRYSARIQSAMGDVTQVADESLGGFREIRLSGAQSLQSQRFESASDNNRLQSMKMALVESLSTPLLQVLVAIAFAVLIWLALAPDRALNMSAGQLVAFLTAASQLGKPVRQLSAVQGVLQRGLVAAEDVFVQLDQPAEGNSGTVSADAISGAITLDNVSFTYPDAGAPALSAVTFTVEPGQTLAIVGPSGSGKSTLLHLLTRFYEPSSGCIAVDGLPIENYELGSLRRNIAVVSQHVPLFRDTLFNNICLGAAQQTSPQQVQAALALAQGAAFAEALPDGIHTMLGDAGAGLSGGEQQRVALARAILKEAPLLFLDEATSALDAESEFYVQQALQAVTQGRTTIVIAHRLSTVENADRILVLDKGKVESVGTHGELLENSVLYQRLHQQAFAE